MIEAPQLHELSAADSRQVEALEQRVQRLEGAVAAMQDTRQLEERLVERVAARINGSMQTAGGSTTGIIIEAGRKFIPAALDTMRSQGGQPEGETGARQPWLLLDIYDEFRSIYWMFLDPRYRLSWTGRLAPLAIVFVLFSSWLFFGTFLWGIVDKVFSLVLIVLAYKVLSREARRYRQMVPGFPTRGRP